MPKHPGTSIILWLEKIFLYLCGLNQNNEDAIETEYIKEKLHV